MAEKIPLIPEVVDEEKERSMEDVEYGFNVVLESATVIFTHNQELTDENLEELERDIMQLEGIDTAEATEGGELKIYTKFGDTQFWNAVIPEVKIVIRKFLDSLPPEKR